MVRSFYSARRVPRDLMGVAYGTRCMRASLLHIIMVCFGPVIVDLFLLQDKSRPNLVFLLSMDFGSVHLSQMKSKK